MRLHGRHIAGTCGCGGPRTDQATWRRFRPEEDVLAARPSFQLTLRANVVRRSPLLTTISISQSVDSSSALARRSSHRIASKRMNAHTSRVSAPRHHHRDRRRACIHLVHPHPDRTTPSRRAGTAPSVGECSPSLTLNLDSSRSYLAEGLRSRAGGGKRGESRPDCQIRRATDREQERHLRLASRTDDVEWQPLKPPTCPTMCRTAR